MAYELGNSFSVCFNIMKIRYIDYDQSFDELQTIGPNDSINVFINLESVFNYITMIKDLDKKLVTEDNFVQIMVSDILNLAAHYKRFFRGNKLQTKVFLYMTSFDSDSFKEMKFNEDYRSYYLNKFNTNPRFSTLTDYLKNEILPEAEQICQFIPNVYIINAKNIDASVIPYAVSNLYSGSKNVIISSDYFDTQYSFKPGFTVHYLRRSPLHSSITYTLHGYLKEIIKRDPDQNTDGQQGSGDADDDGIDNIVADSGNNNAGGSSTDGSSQKGSSNAGQTSVSGSNAVKTGDSAAPIVGSAAVMVLAAAAVIVLLAKKKRA